jgi:hypothetical protein
MVAFREIMLRWVSGGTGYPLCTLGWQVLGGLRGACIYQDGYNSY